MNIVSLYYDTFLFNVANLSSEELAGFLKKSGIKFYEDAKSFGIKSGGWVYPIGTYHVKQIADNMVIGDNYFFKCSNINGEEAVGPLSCPYWNEHTNHEGKCDQNRISFEEMEDDSFTHCTECPYYDNWEDRIGEAEENIINDSLMEMLYYCMKEYEYSKFLFTPVHFSLENVSFGEEPYRCYNTDDKVAIVYKTKNINPIDLTRAIDAHNRIYYACIGAFHDKEHEAAFKTYGITVLPSDYKIQVCTWLGQNDELRQNFYTDASLEFD